MSALLTTDELYQWADCAQRAKLIEWLTANNIAFTLSRKGNPITTLDAINASLMGGSAADEVDF